MPDIEKTQCNYCGSQFLVIFEEEEEVIKYCPSFGEKIEDYIDHGNDTEGDLWDVDWEDDQVVLTTALLPLQFAYMKGKLKTSNLRTAKYTF